MNNGSAQNGRTRKVKKNILFVAALAVAGVRLDAQTPTGGTISFLTKQASAIPEEVLDVKVTGPDGVVWAGPEYLAQLYAGLDADSLSPVGIAISFFAQRLSQRRHGGHPIAARLGGLGPVTGVGSG
jgi:hypothetical protein